MWTSCVRMRCNKIASTCEDAIGWVRSLHTHWVDSIVFFAPYAPMHLFDEFIWASTVHLPTMHTNEKKHSRFLFHLCAISFFVVGVVSTRTPIFKLLNKSRRSSLFIILNIFHIKMCKKVFQLVLIHYYFYHFQPGKKKLKKIVLCI